MRELGVLVSKPLTNFKKVVEILNKHFHGMSKSVSALRGMKFHQTALEDATMFHTIMEKQVLGIDHWLSSECEVSVFQTIFISFQPLSVNH